MHTTNDREVFGDFEIGGHVIRTVKYSGHHVLLAKGETVLLGVIDRLKLEDTVKWKLMWEKL